MLSFLPSWVSIIYILGGDVSLAIVTVKPISSDKIAHNYQNAPIEQLGRGGEMTLSSEFDR